MKEQDRPVINKEQINRFFSSYYSEWRHIQILGVEKKLKTKYEFYSDIVENINYSDIEADEKTIAQEISNGLMFEAIQYSLQYIEDLFALINAAKKPNFFIRSIIQYNAGKVDHAIRTFSIKRKNICECFHFPYFPDEENLTEQELEVQNVINESVDRLGNIIHELVEFYKKYQFFYNQYKHGLSIALRPYHNWTPEQVEEDKKGIHGQSPIVALDSLNFKDAPKNQYGNTGYLLMPCASPIIMPHLNCLQTENNLLRFVMSPPDMSINVMVDVAKKCKRCIHLLIHNFLQSVNEESPLKLRLPSPDEQDVFVFDFPVIEDVSAGNSNLSAGL